MSKSYDVDYAFGQMGSAYTSAAASIIPPKGLVIVAIQFLADNTPTILRSEKKTNTMVAAKYKQAYASTTYVAHNNGDAQQACVDASASTAQTLTGANAAIKVGMQVFSNTEDLLIDLTSASTPDPCTVLSISDENITFSRPVTCSTTTFTFSEENGTGDGGEAISGVVFPKGITIYGRWTEVKPSADADGGVICYFGE